MKNFEGIKRLLELPDVVNCSSDVIKWYLCSQVLRACSIGDDDLLSRIVASSSEMHKQTMKGNAFTGPVNDNVLLIAELLKGKSRHWFTMLARLVTHQLLLLFLDMDSMTNTTKR